MKKLVFLGGTVGNNNWRDLVIKSLSELSSMQIDVSQIFNPVVKDWNDEAQAKEEEAKKNATHFLFYIADPKQEGISLSAYSMVEATMALYDNQEKTVVVFDEEGIAGHSLKAMKQTQKVLKARFPNANILASQSEALNWLKSELAEAI